MICKASSRSKVPSSSSLSPTAAASGEDGLSTLCSESGSEEFVKMRGNAFGGELKSYGTSEFVRLHALFGQPPAEYARDWSDTHEALRSGKLVPKQEATGRSGSLFLKTVRSRFILKTIPQSECLSLRQCLSSYTAFLHRHPHSLLMRFFGLHRYTRNTKVLYICIMNNFFYDPPASPLAALPLSCIYDLKARFHGPHVVHLAAFPPRPSDSSPAPDPGTVLRDDQIDRPFP
ncbi:MAG: hypothetical protein Q8P67_09920, partial [archaeon]|nr:hypothetical protein [archaeon]